MKQPRKPQHILDAEGLEYAAIKSLKRVFEHESMTDEKIMSLIAVFTKKLCFAMYSRKKKRKPSREASVLQVINILSVEGFIHNELKGIIEEMSTLGNSEYVGTTFFHRDRTQSFLSKCFIIIDWYEKKGHKKLRGMNFNKFRELLSGTPEMTINELRKDGVISGETFKQSMADPRITDFQPEEKEAFSGNPIYMSLLIDASYSMLPAEQEVIAAHELAIKRLRDSPHTRSKNLFLAQDLFNHKSTTLNILTVLDEHGSDRVVALSPQNYAPMSTTALFDSLYEAISKIHIEVNSMRRVGKHPSVMICIMTDGDDTESYKYKAEDIKKLMQKLKDDDFHYSSTMIGWINPALNKEQLEALGESIGFSSVIPLHGITRESISEAFEIWTQV